MERQMELQHGVTHPKAEESGRLLQLPESTRYVSANALHLTAVQPSTACLWGTRQGSTASC